MSSLRSATLHLANLVCRIAPVREMFGLRRAMLRFGGIALGKGTRVTTGVAFYGAHVQIGEAVWVGMNTHFYCGETALIHVGDRVDFGPRCSVISGTHEVGTAVRRAGAGASQDVTVGAGSWIGAGTMVLPGAHIGEGTVVAAGSVVITGDYPPNAFLAGVPAKCKGFKS